MVAVINKPGYLAQAHTLLAQFARDTIASSTNRRALRRDSSTPQSMG